MCNKYDHICSRSRQALDFSSSTNIPTQLPVILSGTNGDSVTMCVDSNKDSLKDKQQTDLNAGLPVQTQRLKFKILLKFPIY